MAGARWLVNSPFGRILTAVRDAESRLMFCGYSPLYFKLTIWVLSAVLCALAGALYVPQVGIINPSEMSPANSIEMVIWVALGARYFDRPDVGGRFGEWRKSWFTVAFPEYWLFFLGFVFIAATLFLPHGVVGWWRRLWRKSA